MYADMSTLAPPLLSDMARRARSIAARPASEARRLRFRIATYNIWCGQRWPRVLETLRANPADVICLQEVLGDNRAEDGWATASTVAAALGGAWQFAELWRSVERPCGNLTLVPRGKVHPATILQTATSEPYGLLTDVELQGVRLRVANLHLAPLPNPPLFGFAPSELLRMREALDFERRVAGDSRPLLACGDYNTFYPAPAYHIAARRMRDARRVVGGRHPATRPTYGLPFVIDHVFVSSHFDVEDYRVVVSDGSDHRLVVSTLSCPMP